MSIPHTTKIQTSPGRDGKHIDRSPPTGGAVGAVVCLWRELPTTRAGLKRVRPEAVGPLGDPWHVRCGPHPPSTILGRTRLKPAPTGTLLPSRPRLNAPFTGASNFRHTL